MRSVSEHPDSKLYPDLPLLRRAEEAVRSIAEDERLVEVLRCHELARAVGALLDLPVQDGHSPWACQHSWLWTSTGNVLDVYAVGRLPQVQLVGWSWPNAEYRRLYIGGPPRRDIVQPVVLYLLECMRLHAEPDVDFILAGYGGAS